VAPHVRQTKFAGDSAMLLCGEDRYRHFAAYPRPTEDFGAAVRALQIAVNPRRGRDAAGRATATTIAECARSACVSLRSRNVSW
jgi:hypothetical protein